MCDGGKELVAAYPEARLKLRQGHSEQGILSESASNRKHDAFVRGSGRGAVGDDLAEQ